VLGEELDDPRLDVDPAAARGCPPVASAAGRRTAHRASRGARRHFAIVGVELADLLLKPSEMLLDFSALDLERLNDLLNTRQLPLLADEDLKIRASTS
jgi:hypothetical protein